MLKKIERWMYLMLNKKQPRPHEAYMGVAVTWFIIGMFFIMTATMVNLTITRYQWPLLIVSLVMFFALIVLAWSTINVDKKSGYYKAIHDNAVRHWHEKRKGYGVE